MFFFHESQSQCTKSHFPASKKANPSSHFTPSRPSCDVSFCDSFVKNNVYKSKTDVYSDGAYVLAKTGHVSCPFNLLRRYVSAANLGLSSSLPFFRSLYFHKATSIYSLRSAGVNYSRMREIVLQAFVELGYQNNLFGLHSLRAGGASAAANSQVLAIGFLSVMEGGKRIKLKTVILRTN